MIENDRKSKETLKKNPNYVGDPSYILNRTSEIELINGVQKSPIEVQMYVESMNAMDSAYFQQAYDKVVSSVGMSTECKDICPNCNEEVIFDLPFNSEFFRPTFDI